MIEYGNISQFLMYIKRLTKYSIYDIIYANKGDCMKKEFYLVEIVDKRIGEVIAMQVCVCKQEIEEIVVSNNYEIYIIPCDKETALKSLKSFKNAWQNNINMI